MPTRISVAFTARNASATIERLRRPPSRRRAFTQKPMNEIRLHNTLTGRTDPFVPLHPGEVRIYTCGPTVYDFAHIGNFRTFLFQDLLRRFLRSRGYRINQVMNLTDVDDRIIQNAAAAGISIREYTDKYIQAFKDDMLTLGMETPEHLVRATDHIPRMVDLIQRLAARGLTYTSEGSIYYRITGFPAYGRLSKIDMSGIEAGARVDVDRYEKNDARDFALWKAPKTGEHFWETAIGPGRPGWHIECSAMAMAYLGDTLDIHTGGVDLAFPHHENEIAQSEAATGKPFVRFWLHAEHLLVEGEKMSKSLGNFYTLRDLLAKGHKPSTIRFLLASVPYRRQLNFTMDSLQQAASSVDRLRNFVSRLESEKLPVRLSACPDGAQPESGAERIADRVKQAEDDFDAGLSSDLNTAVALAAVFDLARDVNVAIDRGEVFQDDIPPILAALRKFDVIFAVLPNDDDGKLRRLGYLYSDAALSDSAVEKLVTERQAARQARDFEKSDEIRRRLADSGIILEDTRDGGVRWKRK
jgi:cysteinyl-tRNA synthetase